MYKIFVYGTLKVGRGLHDILAAGGAKFVGEGTTVRSFMMYDAGAFPVVMQSNSEESKPIRGEIYVIDDRTKARLDRVENVSSGMYRREPVYVKTDTGLESAEIYVGTRQFWHDNILSKIQPTENCYVW